MTIFQIVLIDEDGEETILLHEVRKTDRLPLSIKSLFKGFVGQNAKLISCELKDVVVLGRGGVLTEAGKKATSITK